jgi:hypothetical protein
MKNKYESVRQRLINKLSTRIFRRNQRGESVTHGLPAADCITTADVPSQ